MFIGIIDSVHFQIMAEAPNDSKLLRLLRRKLASIGRGHFLPTTITNQNAFLCLAAATTQDEFNYVMAYSCYHAAAVFNRPDGDFIILFHNIELIMRAVRWLIRELNRDVNDE